MSNQAETYPDITFIIQAKVLGKQQTFKLVFKTYQKSSLIIIYFHRVHIWKFLKCPQISTTWPIQAMVGLPRSILSRNFCCNLIKFTNTVIDVVYQCTVGKQMQGVGWNFEKNQGQLSFPPNIMKFGQQGGKNYTYAQVIRFCCNKFVSMNLYTFPITSEPEVRPLQLRCQNFSLKNLKVPSENSMCSKYCALAINSIWNL